MGRSHCANDCVHEVQIYTGKHGGAEASSGTTADKQIERKILHMCMDLLFFSSQVLLCLKALVVIEFTVFVLYLDVGKGIHRL